MSPRGDSPVPSAATVAEPPEGWAAVSFRDAGLDIPPPRAAACRVLLAAIPGPALVAALSRRFEEVHLVDTSAARACAADAVCSGLPNVSAGPFPGDRLAHVPPARFDVVLIPGADAALPAAAATTLLPEAVRVLRPGGWLRCRVAQDALEPALQAVRPARMAALVVTAGPAGTLGLEARLPGGAPPLRLFRRRSAAG